MFEFTPESDAFIWSDSKRKEIDKRNKDATKLDLPNHYMMQAMQSNETLDKILPDIDTSTITPEQLENARYYFSIVGDEEELKFNLEQQPEVVKQWENDFDYVSRNLDQAVDIAKDSLPDVGISFWDAQNMTSKDYTLFASPETRYAINRKNLDNFLKTTLQGDPNITDDRLLREVLRDDLVTGNMFLELGGRFKDIARFFEGARVALRVTASDFFSAIGQSNGDFSKFKNYWNQSRPKREQLKTTIEELKKDEGWLTAQHLAFNDWIKDKYVEKHGEEAYDLNAANLTLNPQQVKDIFDYTFQQVRIS